MGEMQSLNRRQFLVTTSVVSGGMLLGLSFDAGAGTSPANAEFTPWISIAPDSAVTVRVASPEIGNGVMTQAAMNVAEELGCAWKDVRAEFAPPERNYAEKGVYTKAGGGLAYFSGRSTTPERLKLALQ